MIFPSYCEESSSVLFWDLCYARSYKQNLLVRYLILFGKYGNISFIDIQHLESVRGNREVSIVFKEMQRKLVVTQIRIKISSLCTQKVFFLPVRNEVISADFKVAQRQNTFEKPKSDQNNFELQNHIRAPHYFYSLLNIVQWEMNDNRKKE